MSVREDLDRFEALLGVRRGAGNPRLAAMTDVQVSELRDRLAAAVTAVDDSATGIVETALRALDARRAAGFSADVSSADVWGELAMELSNTLRNDTRERWRGRASLDHRLDAGMVVLVTNPTLTENRELTRALYATTPLPRALRLADARAELDGSYLDALAHAVAGRAVRKPQNSLNRLCAHVRPGRAMKSQRELYAAAHALTVEQWRHTIAGALRDARLTPQDFAVTFTSDSCGRSVAVAADPPSAGMNTFRALLRFALEPLLEAAHRNTSP